MPAADKVDLYKQHRDEYATPKKPALIETRPATYLATDGHGPPTAGMFEARVGALYGMAYTLKFNSKAAGRDYVVCKLEGLWDAEEVGSDFAGVDMDTVRWTLLIRVPEFVGDDDLDEARRTLRERGKDGDFDAVRLETIDEGRCVQVLHVGPYENERVSIEAMRELVDAEGLRLHGRHHEIYLSDPRRVPPEKLRTILRQPVK